MHELSIALSLLALAEDEALRRDISVIAIHVQIGPLSGVVKDALLAAYDVARFESPLLNARLTIEETQVRIACPTCRGERDVVSVQDLRCVECGTASSDIVSGRELDIIALEIP